jgi:hypothetical protein
MAHSFRQSFTDPVPLLLCYLHVEVNQTLKINNNNALKLILIYLSFYKGIAA